MLYLAFLLALCAFVCLVVYALAARKPPTPDEPDSEPFPEFIPDMTASTAKTLRESIK